MRILEVDRLGKRFGGLAAAADVGFHVDEGEIVGLIGPNGAGKTTVFNLISGALVPDSGTIQFRDKKITGKKPHQICRAGIARTFQSVQVFPRISVLDHVRLAQLFGNPKSRSGGNKWDAAQILDFVELSGMSALRAMDLTLANQKRLEVARALAAEPELLLLDEVMAGLNPTEVSQAMELARKIQERGVTILMIEHVMKAIMNICDRIIVLNYGQKIAEGVPREIAANQTVIEVYLGATEISNLKSQI
ncbi:MAG: ABC transporter ATP-binding protein [Deltaproteobacteria bacterium HGW-Deltaproteobacteria-15]|jgi:branched-chain amino acid transport system ATP-binding protein|nr:MAG: ABC transporter ATP-binding protein [Deltaproteobacteria bacterium HGW-Deltaproteobacteria-15]